MSLIYLDGDKLLSSHDIFSINNEVDLKTFIDNINKTYEDNLLKYEKIFVITDTWRESHTKNISNIYFNIYGRGEINDK